MAHKPIDLAKPEANGNNPGNTPEERRSGWDRFLDAGWVDTFRPLNRKPGQYTWRS